ncbi:MAG TPA: DUF2279 domain-containing protein [Flavobacteriales bacterium]|nr:DUF2279 domain-containing protein [Flavobacteriales bacterium]
MPGTAFPARGGGEIGGADTLTDKRCQRCLIWTGGVTTAAMAATYVSLDQAWYAQYERTPLHSFNDGDEWLQMDKAGHLFSAYTLGNWGHAAVSHCGASASTSRWVGGSLGLVFLTGVEILDGTSSGWGFSWWDMAANAAGATLFIGQDALWAEQRLQLKLSAHHTEFAPQRPDLLGSGPIERYLKDYNGQTIWLSANLDRFSPGAVPPWLSVAIGYGAERMTSARVSTGDVVVAPMPYRQFYLAPDVDLTRIKTRSRSLRTLLFVLNSIKIPAPTLEFTSEGHFVGHWLYF